MVNDAELVLDAITGFKYDHLYHRNYALGSFRIPARMATYPEQMEPLGRLRRLIARKMSESKPLSKRRYIQQVGVNFDPGIVTLRLQEGSTYFDAFGQSEQYFVDISKLLKQDLVMSEPVDLANQEMAKKIAKDAEDTIGAEMERARETLRAEASRLALQLAEERIKQMLTPADDEKLKKTLIQDLAA